MNIDDPELLAPVKAEDDGAKRMHIFIFTSIWCRNVLHNRCSLASCQCQCHRHQAELLKNQLLYGPHPSEGGM